MPGETTTTSDRPDAGNGAKAPGCSPWVIAGNARAGLGDF